MRPEERIEELQNALGSIYRVRMGTSHRDLGDRGASEIVLAETLVHRAIERARGRPVKTALPRLVRELRRELEVPERGT